MLLGADAQACVRFLLPRHSGPLCKKMMPQTTEKPERKRRRIQPSSEDECESDGDGCESVSSDGSDSMGSLRDFIVDGSCSEGEGVGVFSSIVSACDVCAWGWACWGCSPRCGRCRGADSSTAAVVGHSTWLVKEVRPLS